MDSSLRIERSKCIAVQQISTDGYIKMGPVRYAEFHFTGDEEAKVLDQRYASGLIQNLLDLIRDSLDKRRVDR